MGYMNGQWMDVHGSGAQRSDPKTGNPEDYPYGRGPQGDDIHIYNYVRLVRNGTQAIPEFPSWIILPLFLTATLFAIVIKKRLFYQRS
jgi:hypothetical protein